MLIKQKSPSLSRNLALGTFGKLPIVFSTKVNLLYLLYSTARRRCLLYLIKQNCLLKTFLRTLILMTQVKLHNISVTPKMVKKVITNLDLLKAPGPDCIPVVNCEPELSYILAELFNKCLKESCFPDCWKVSSVVPVFRNVRERSTAKNYRPVSLPPDRIARAFNRLGVTRAVPLDGTHLDAVRGLIPTKRFHPSASTSVYNRQVNRSLQHNVKP